MVRKVRYTVPRKRTVTSATRHGRGSVIKYTTGGRSGQVFGFKHFPRLTARAQGRLRWGGAMSWLQPRKR